MVGCSASEARERARALEEARLARSQAREVERLRMVEDARERREARERQRETVAVARTAAAKRPARAGDGAAVVQVRLPSGSTLTGSFDAQETLAAVLVWVRAGGEGGRGGGAAASQPRLTPAQQRRLEAERLRQPGARFGPRRAFTGTSNTLAGGGSASAEIQALLDEAREAHERRTAALRDEASHQAFDFAVPHGEAHRLGDEVEEGEGDDADDGVHGFLVPGIPPREYLGFEALNGTTLSEAGLVPRGCLVVRHDREGGEGQAQGRGGFAHDEDDEEDDYYGASSGEDMDVDQANAPHMSQAPRAPRLAADRSEILAALARRAQGAQQDPPAPEPQEAAQSVPVAPAALAAAAGHAAALERKQQSAQRLHALEAAEARLHAPAAPSVPSQAAPGPPLAQLVAEEPAAPRRQSPPEHAARAAAAAAARLAAQEPAAAPGGASPSNRDPESRLATIRARAWRTPEQAAEQERTRAAEARTLRQDTAARRVRVMKLWEEDRSWRRERARGGGAAAGAEGAGAESLGQQVHAPTPSIAADAEIRVRLVLGEASRVVRFPGAATLRAVRAAGAALQQGVAPEDLGLHVPGVGAYWSEEELARTLRDTGVGGGVVHLMRQETRGEVRRYVPRQRHYHYPMHRDEENGDDYEDDDYEDDYAEDDDPQTYEELLALQERIGSVRNGLSPARRSHVVRSTAEASAELSACAICQHDIAAGEEIATLPCGHTFHCECVDDWLRISKACPTCRRRI